MRNNNISVSYTHLFRTKSDAVYVSVPSGTTMKEVKRAIEDLRSKLLASRQRLNLSLIHI